MLIRDGYPSDGLHARSPANADDGRGWVSGRLVGTTLVAVNLRTAPRWDGQRLDGVANFGGPGSSPESVGVVVHCPRLPGKYVEVTGSPLSGKTVARLVVRALFAAAHVVRRIVDEPKESTARVAVSSSCRSRASAWM